jgi:hypothetical protein
MFTKFYLRTKNQTCKKMWASEKNPELFSQVLASVYSARLDIKDTSLDQLIKQVIALSTGIFTVDIVP